MSTEARTTRNLLKPVSVAVENLGKRFNREWIFRNLTYTFKSGHTYAVTGPNGSGKSTLMQILWGQSLPSAGTILYQSADEIIPETEIFRKISIATPYMDLIEELTLEEHVKLHTRLKKMREGIDADVLIDTLKLQGARTKQIMNFSSGMRQRLKLGLAFYTQSEVLFLDEPGTNLDKQAFDWYTEKLHETGQNRLVFIASNNPEEYRSASDVINILDFK